MSDSCPLWSWSELCKATQQPISNGPNITGIQFDSRLVKPGDLFVPLPGDPGPRFKVAARSDRDGHDFITDAIERGVAATLTSRRMDINVPSLKVADTIDALWELARFRRKQLKCPVIAVTGSSGKTTFKAYMSSILGATEAPESFNNYIGLPFSIACTPIHAESAIFEIGTNHEGEIEPLSKLAEPNIAVLLNVLPAHIGNFESFKSLEKEKFSIQKGLLDDAVLIYPKELSQSPYISPEYRTINFGFQKPADIQVDLLDTGSVNYRHQDDVVEILVPGGGSHRAQTLAACAGVLVALERPLSDLKSVNQRVPEGRGNLREVGTIAIIDDSYNANPTSVQLALEQVSNTATPGRRIAILGQMNELGEDAKKYHAGLANYLISFDELYCVGKLMQHLVHDLPTDKKVYYYSEVSQQLIDDVCTRSQEHDLILVKGSNTVFWTNRFVDKLIQQLADQ